MPTNQGRATYVVEGPLGLVFNFFKDQEDPSDPLGGEELENAESPHEHCTMTERELEFFCYAFGIIGAGAASKCEIFAVAKHCEGRMHCEKAEGIHLADFINITARIAILLYPRLPFALRDRLLREDEINIVSAESESEHHLRHDSVRDEQKWRAFAQCFHLHHSDAVKHKLKYARRLLFEHRGIPDIPKPLVGCKQDLFRLGMSARLGKSMGRKLHWNMLPHAPLSNVMVAAVRRSVYTQPVRDWREFNIPYINFYRVVVDEKHPQVFSAKIKITDTDSKCNGIRLFAELDHVAPKCFRIPPKYQRSAKCMTFGTTFYSMLLLDTAKCTFFGECMFYVEVLGVKEMFLSKRQKTILRMMPAEKRKQLLYQIPVYVHFVRKSEKQCYQKLPDLKAVKSLRNLKVEMDAQDATGNHDVVSWLKMQRPSTSFN